jgi:hypothetical protein
MLPDVTAIITSNILKKKLKQVPYKQPVDAWNETDVCQYALSAITLGK